MLEHVHFHSFRPNFLQLCSFFSIFFNTATMQRRPSPVLEGHNPARHSVLPSRTRTGLHHHQSPMPRRWSTRSGRILIPPALMPALLTWARGVRCFYYHIGYLENLENTDRKKGSLMLVSWWCDDATLFSCRNISPIGTQTGHVQTWIFPFFHVFFLFCNVGTRFTLQQQNE